MRVTVRLLGALLLATTTLTACSQSTSGTAEPGTVTPTNTAATSARSLTSPPTSSETETSAPAPSSATAAMTATTAVTTVTVTTSAINPVPPTDLSGGVYGFVKGVDVARSEITLDKIDWFTGAAAAQACAEDGITSTDNHRCTGYHYRNVNPALRVVGVSPQATISTLANGVNPATGNLADVSRRIATPGGDGNIYQLVVTDGLVTDLREMYRP